MYSWTELSLLLRKNKLPYYVKNGIQQLIPQEWTQRYLPAKLQYLKQYETEETYNRVHYYNKLSSIKSISAKALPINQVLQLKPSTYRYDTFQYSRYFDPSLKADFLFGDIIHVPVTPSLQKSRPINGNNANAVLLNLDKKRHFLFINDPIPTSEKKNLLIGRGNMTQPHRISFMERYFGHPLIDVGQVNYKGGKPEWIRPKLSIYEHLKYKFILSLEGNDVATNLKWIMSSNSVAVMPPPRYETWFMEGKLIPNVHYIAIQPDYSDVEEVLNYYINHPLAVAEIVHNAQKHVKTFNKPAVEDLISLQVLQKYFEKTGQLTPSFD